MPNPLEQYIPIPALPQVMQLLERENVYIKIKNERKTRHGDYRQMPNGKHQITVNANLNPYQFLITLIHEIAHFEAYTHFGRKIKPHGLEWKQTFQHLMLPFLNPEVFPNEILGLLAKHFKNPKASSDTDVKLAYSLKQFNKDNYKTYIFEIPLGSTFKIYNGRMFKKGNQRTKRFECVEIANGKTYLFNPNAEVELINNG